MNKIAMLLALQPVITSSEVEGFGAVQIRQISVTESERIRVAGKDAPAADFGLRLVIASVVESDGSSVFDESDLPALQGSADAKMSKLVERVLEVNGYKAPAFPNASR